MKVFENDKTAARLTGPTAHTGSEENAMNWLSTELFNLPGSFLITCGIALMVCTGNVPWTSKFIGKRISKLLADEKTGHSTKTERDELRYYRHDVWIKRVSIALIAAGVVQFIYHTIIGVLN